MECFFRFFLVFEFSSARGLAPRGFGCFGSAVRSNLSLILSV